MDKNNWEYKEFEDCLHKVKYPPKVKTNEYLSLGLYPVVSQEKEYISGYNDDENKVFHHNNPVVIFGDHSREIKYIDFDFIIGADGVKILDVKDFLNPKFFYYNIKWINVESLGYSRHYKLLKENKIPIPPLAEQERIVEELDLLSSIIEKKKAQLKELDQLAQSIFYDMFGDPITNEKGWEVKKLGEVCIIERGGSPRPIEQYLTDDENGINWIKIGDATEGGMVISSTKQKIIPEGVKKSRFVHKGDFLLSNSMSFGKPYILGVDGCIHDGWLVIQDPNEIFNKIYLYYFLGSPQTYESFRSMAVGGVVNNLNKDMVKRVFIAIPNPTLQQEFADKIEAIERQKSLIQQSIVETQTLFDSRMDYWFG